MKKAILLMAICACNTSQLTAYDKAIAAGTSALVPVENLACTIAKEVDPTGGTADCSAIDSTGNLVGVVFTVVEDVSAIAALTGKTSVAMQQAVKAKKGTK